MVEIRSSEVPHPSHQAPLRLSIGLHESSLDPSCHTIRIKLLDPNSKALIVEDPKPVYRPEVYKLCPSYVTQHAEEIDISSIVLGNISRIDIVLR